MREYLLYIDGGWRKGGGGATTAVSPSSGEAFATVADADPADVASAVAGAGAAWPGWAGASAFERSDCCDVGGRFAMEAFTEPKTVVYPAPQLRA